MIYKRISYADFAPYRISKIKGSEIKIIEWERQKKEICIDELGPFLHDENTTIKVISEIVMPFDVYIIPRDNVAQWTTFLNNSNTKISNSVYILFGHDFIYAGKAINGSRILDHEKDPEKINFEYQMLFVPNYSNSNSNYYWVSAFMDYLESILIDRLSISKYCKNKASGKSAEKNARDLNLQDENKSLFAENIIDLMLLAFVDITCHRYLLPQDFLNSEYDSSYKEGDVDSTNMKPENVSTFTSFWERFLSQTHKEFIDVFGNKSVPPYNYLGKSIASDIPGTSLGCCLTKNNCRVEICGWGSKDFKENNNDVFDCLYANKDAIEFELGCSLMWDRQDDKYSTRICISKSLQYNNPKDFEQICAFFDEFAPKLKRTLSKYYKFSKQV